MLPSIAVLGEIVLFMLSDPQFGHQNNASVREVEEHFTVNSKVFG